jgi:hypothetical protein
MLQRPTLHAVRARSRRARALGVLVQVSIVSLACPTAFAQGTAPGRAAAPAAKPVKPRTVREELPENARRDWDAARDLLEASDYAGALVEYLRAYEVSKNPRVLYNVGVCEKNLRHYARAVARFKQELGEGGATGRLSPQETEDVKDAIHALEQFVSTVEVTASEAGATLFIDADEAGTTPFLAPVPIDVGPHALRLHKDGFADVTHNVTIAGGAPAKASFVLDPLVKKTLVTITVSGAPVANVVIDGIDMGQSPFKGELAAGRHTFEARAPGFVTARQTTDVVWKTPLQLSLDESAERHEGKVRVEAQPASATIEIDGKVLGSGVWEGALPTGGHQLIVRKPGYQPYTAEITLNDDQQRSVKATLVEERIGSSWIAWTVGTVVVVGGGIAASYFLFKPTDQQPVIGTLDPGTVPAHVRF